VNPSRGLRAAVLVAGLTAPAFGHDAPFAPPAPAADAPVAAPYPVSQGRCVGTGAPSPQVVAGPAFTWKGPPPTPKMTAFWEVLGYRIDGLPDGPHRFLDASGRAMPAGEYRRLSEPFDASKEALDPLIWSSLMGRGYRLDETKCVLLSPGTRSPLTLADILYARSTGQAGALHETLGDILASLRAAPAGKPVPPEVLLKIKQAESAGVKIPASLRAALKGAANAGTAAASVETAYADSTRYFDRARGLQGMASSALPVIPWINAPPKPSAYQDSLETVLGRVFQADLTDRFRLTNAGNRMLDRFRDDKRVLHLPDIVMVKMSQKPFEGGYGMSGAVANSASNAIEINHWDAARTALATAPAKDRARLAKDFSDPAKLARYLLNHREAREAFLDEEDVVFYHELTHIWQFQRDASSVETLRGNAPAMNPLEREDEAYREECRYFADKLALHPRKAVQSPEMARYQMLLAQGYSGLKSWVEQNYVGTFAGSTNFKTVEQVQAQRESVAARLQKTGAYMYALEALKKIGLAIGAKAVQEDAAAYRRRDAEFGDRILPAMRRDSYPRMIDAFESLGSPGDALSTILEIPPSERAADGVSAQALERARAQAAALLAKPGEMVPARYAAWKALEKDAQIRKTPLPAGARAGKEFAAGAKLYLGAALKTADPQKRFAWTYWGKIFMNDAPAKDLPALKALVAKLEVK
jgi:hypothetical protein